MKTKYVVIQNNEVLDVFKDFDSAHDYTCDGNFLTKKVVIYKITEEKLFTANYKNGIFDYGDFTLSANKTLKKWFNKMGFGSND